MALDPSQVARALWSKTHRNDDATHPLLCHLIDVAEVAHAIWERSLSRSLKQFVADACCVNVDDLGRTWAFWAGCHDLGKASPGFQRKHGPSFQELINQGLPFPPLLVNTPCYHAWITSSTLGPLAADASGTSAFAATDLAIALGGHHGLWPSSNQAQGQDGHRGSGIWDELRLEIVNTMANLYRPAPLDQLGRSVTERNAVAALFSGYVSVADWIGSDEDFFSFEHTPRDFAEYQSIARARAERALSHHGWNRRFSPREPAAFSSLFPPYAPNPMQSCVIGLAEKLTGPSLVIIEAPTGLGKTEAALFLADTWTRKLDQRGIYVAMPTMATSNQMHQRVQRFLAGRFPDDPIDPLLIHGMAQWTEPVATPSVNIEDEGASATSPANAEIGAWFLQRKRSLLAPAGVGTVDQALLSVLQTRHFFVRLLGLSHKTMVFDEVHAYDTYMSTLFELLLQWLRAVNASVVILTATLPRTTRVRLMRAWQGGDLAEIPDVQYPAVSWSDGEQCQSVPIEDVAPRRVDLEQVDAESPNLVELLRWRLHDGGHAAVICNTVARAQEVFQALREAALVDDADLILFHARFPFAWREQIEKDVLSRYGPQNVDRSTQKRSIVVATQVIEQSLDLDFDFMVSDLCPIDLLIQRAGRLHRHVRPRPAPLQSPTIVIARSLNDGEPVFGSDRRIYDENVLLRTWIALRGRTHIETPTDTSELIDWVYSDQPPADGLPAALLERLARAEGEAARKREKEEHEAADRMAPAPDKKRMLQQQSLGLAEDSPETHAALQALTRLGPPTVPIVCLHAQGDALFTEPDGAGLRIVLTRPPTQAEVVALARSVVTVQRHDVVQFLRTARQMPAAWSKHALLSTHHLAIFRSGACQWDGAPFRLLLDRRLGLSIEKEGK